jgi:hypothetical protein
VLVNVCLHALLGLLYVLLCNLLGLVHAGGKGECVLVIEMNKGFQVRPGRGLVLTLPGLTAVDYLVWAYTNGGVR